MLLPLLLILCQRVDQPVRAVTDPGIVTTRQAITPAGVPTVFEGRVYGVAFGASSDELWVLNATQLYRLNWRTNEVKERLTHGGSPGPQSLAFDGVPVYTVTRRGEVLLGEKAVGRTLAGGLAARAKTVAIPLTFENQLAVVRGGETTKVRAGIAPFAAVLSSDAAVAYVSNWGGRLPKSGELTAPTGFDPKADRVVVDARGIAATGSVTRIDLKTMQATHTIATGLHPTGMAWDEAKHRLYVAENNAEAIAVIDTRTQAVVARHKVQPFAREVRGIAPGALALSPDGATLYAACGGINAVAVITAATGKIEGLIPTAWYPASLSLSAGGNHLAVGAILGAGSGWRDAPAKRFVHAYRGAVTVVDIPDRAQLANFTTAAIENNRMAQHAGAPPRPVAGRKPVAIPERAGEPSLIEHVVYIVKENRTYDQVLGDLAKGNGDKSLVMFGEDVTPNHHRLSDQFVTLDNFYATGGNSADGHQWVTQANETAYCLWPGYGGRSYPFDGSDPIAYSSGGFLWDSALKLGKTVRIYGEYAGRLPEPASSRVKNLERWKRGEDFSKDFNTVAPIASMNKILAAQFPAYSNAVPDVVRADLFLKDLDEWKKAGRMPNLTIVQLPSDHTYGASPGVSTPQSMVADNDWALGKIVDGLSHSPFWKKMAIFVVEDDAQNGVDHVDGHRTVALAISPYTKRGSVDSTFYAHQSILKTIELILGLPTLSLFDLIANDMRASFWDKADESPYSAVEPKQSLFEVNKAVSALRGQARLDAIASAKMRWEVPDAVPTERLNRILWRLVRGNGLPYPGVRQAVFAPLSLDIADDDR